MRCIAILFCFGNNSARFLFSEQAKKEAEDARLIYTAQRDLDKCKEAHSVEVKRNTALMAILKTLTVS